MFRMAKSNVLPCHVMLMSALARCASSTVLTNDSMRSSFVHSLVLKKIRTSCGWSATTLASIVASAGGGPLIFA